jgi:hypothetical protein
MTNQPENTSPAPQAPFPTAQTLFRVVGLRQDFDRTLQATFKASSAQPSPDEVRATKHILAADSPVDIVRLAPLSRGVVQLFWIQRMNEVGMAALPAIVRRLKSSQSIGDENDRHLVCERLIGALKRLGAPGGQALLECFNNLDDYGQSMAALTLGALHVSAAVEPIWHLYQRVKKNPQVNYLVGALWGLIDLQHPGLDEALAELLSANPQRLFAELYPFTALAGGKTCVGPLTVRFNAVLQDGDHYAGERDDILMALTAVGQRMDQFEAELLSILEAAESAHAITNMAASRTAQEVEHYFQMYYQRPD